MGYVIAAITDNFGPGGWDAYLIKTDSVGDTLWTKAYGGTGFEAGYSVQQTVDGGYVMTGVSGSFGVGSAINLYLVKTDALGNTSCNEYATATIVGNPSTSQTSSTILVGSGAIANGTATMVSNPSDSALMLCSVLVASASCNIVINEVAFKPDGGGTAQATREWVELYNSSCTDTVDLTGWYIRSDVNNDVFNPVYGDDMIVTWATRNPGTLPYDAIVGPLDTNTIMIPPQRYRRNNRPNME